MKYVLRLGNLEDEHFQHIGRFSTAAEASIYRKFLVSKGEIEGDTYFEIFPLKVKEKAYTNAEVDIYVSKVLNS